MCIAKRYTGREQVVQPINKEIQDIQVLQKHRQCKQKEEEKVNKDLKSYLIKIFALYAGFPVLLKPVCVSPFVNLP